MDSQEVGIGVPRRVPATDVGGVPPPPEVGVGHVEALVAGPDPLPRGRPLVEVIAAMQHEIDVVAVGEPAVRVEPARPVVRARHDTEAETVDVGGRRVRGAADGRVVAQRPEPVVVPRRRLETLGVDLHREVTNRRRRRRAPAHDRDE
jgi:hypothetical protein